MPAQIWAVESVDHKGLLSPQIICLSAEAALAVVAALIGLGVASITGVRLTMRRPLEGEISHV